MLGTKKFSEVLSDLEPYIPEGTLGTFYIGSAGSTFALVKTEGQLKFHIEVSASFREEYNGTEYNIFNCRDSYNRKRVFTSHSWKQVKCFLGDMLEGWV